MNEFDDDIASDFYSLIGGAQLNELQEVERRRDAEREAMKRLEEERCLVEGRAANMTLMQIAGLQSQKEVDAATAEKNAADEKRIRDEDTKRKEIEHARLVNQFPPPIITDNS